jgi:hypothetical protein
LARGTGFRSGCRPSRCRGTTVTRHGRTARRRTRSH